MPTRSRLPRASTRLTGLMLLLAALVSLFLSLQTGSDPLRLLLAVKGALIMGAAAVLMRQGQRTVVPVPARRARRG